MKLDLTVESKNFEHDCDMQSEIEKNPCNMCLFGQGPMCVERKFCRWHSHKEIYIKVKVQETK